MLQKAY